MAAQFAQPFDHYCAIEFTVTDKQMAQDGDLIQKLLRRLFEEGSLAVTTGPWDRNVYKVTYRPSVTNHVAVRHLATIISDQNLYDWATREVAKIESMTEAQHAVQRAMRAEAIKMQADGEPSIPEGVYIPEGW